MPLSINYKALIILSLTFIAFTVIGTLSHEAGHIAVAKLLGYQTELHYGSMNYYGGKTFNTMSEIYREYAIELEKGTDFKRKTELEQAQRNYQKDTLLITIGGPLQTILTGTIGLLFLLWRRKHIALYGLGRLDWLAIFLSLFWLREAFNLTMSIVFEILAPNGSWFGGDELRISSMLNFWPGTFSIILGIIGTFVSFYILFSVIPARMRLTFICSGLLGGISGFILWLHLLGPVVLP